MQRICRTIPYFIINIFKAATQEYTDSRGQVLVVRAKFSETVNRCGSHDGIFQNDPVVNKTDVLVRLRHTRTLGTEQVKDAHIQLCELAVLDKFTQVT